jgi:thiaminase
MFMSAGSPGVSALEGMAVLWATEVCYLRAWRYAASYGKKKAQQGKADVDADGGALREKFIPNWSSKEFEEFVNRIGDVLDEMVGKMKGVEETEVLRARCLEWWRQVVWLEERFWPAMD